MTDVRHCITIIAVKKKDVVVEKLIIEADREEHVAKHNVKIDEILEILSGDYIYIQSKFNRWLLIGRTKKARFLTIVVGKRKEKNTYGLVTTRPSRKEEKSFYQEFTFEGGEKDEKNRKS